MNGKFVISLDFELSWGILGKKTVESYGQNILGVHQVIPRLLKTFEECKIKATFATVGLLFLENKSEIFDNLPTSLPNYKNKNLSPYLGYFDQVGENAITDLYHFAPNLIKQISKYPDHEIGTHTFSHYYCLEKGQNKDDFKADIQNAQKLAKKYNLKLTSLVFPRNQFNDDYLQICKELGIICYRGNEHSWLYNARSREEDSLIRRALRLLDAYINISGHNCYSDEYLKSQYPIDIPSSRFLRPFSLKLNFLEELRLKRIKSGMTFAAKNDMTYHLWWHPHNFGINQDQNFTFLNKILCHYNNLNYKYNFQSCTMTGLASSILIDEKKNVFQNSTKTELVPQILNEKKKIILLGGKRSSTNIVFNFLNSNFGVHTAIIEDKESLKMFIRRRMKKLGLVRVFGQGLFQFIVPNILNIFSQKRKEQIIKNNELNFAKIPKDKKKNVSSINSDISIRMLKEINPDLIIVNGTRIISKKVLSSVNCKFINIHAGITPKYRGVHGTYWALSNDDSENSGVTVHFIDDGIDTGNIIYQAKVTHGKNDNFVTYPLLQLSAGLGILKKAIDEYFTGQIHTKLTQGVSTLCYHPTIWQYLYNRIVKKVK